MKVLILGIDGYIGWPLAQYLLSRDHEVFGIDNYSRRGYVGEVRSQSAIPIYDMFARSDALLRETGKTIDYSIFDIKMVENLRNYLKRVQPEVIIHLAEMPSAPFSMIDVEHAIETQKNNVIGTLNLLFAMKDVCPDAHLLKLGTMGEYGTPNIDIPEGFFEIEYKGRKDKLPFPKQAGSWYHQSKVHDTNNIMLACKLWGLKSTDVMQGVVYGTNVNVGDKKELATRLDFDECFGTVIHRFCCQAVIGEPLTVYGNGGQRRGFLSLSDSIKCLTIAAENPPEQGEYRVFNQFSEVFGIDELAKKVKTVSEVMGEETKIKYLDNPRVEKDEHYYNPEHKKLIDLGYDPQNDLDGELFKLFTVLKKNKKRIEEKKECLNPITNWR